MTDYFTNRRAELEKKKKDLINMKENPIALIDMMNSKLLSKYRDNPSWNAYCYVENLQGCKRENERIDKEIAEIDIQLQELALAEDACKNHSHQSAGDYGAVPYANKGIVGGKESIPNASSCKPETLGDTYIPTPQFDEFVKELKDKFCLLSPILLNCKCSKCRTIDKLAEKFKEKGK